MGLTGSSAASSVTLLVRSHTRSDPEQYSIAASMAARFALHVCVSYPATGTILFWWSVPGHQL